MTVIARNVEEGSPGAGGNKGGADPEPSLRAYNARKRRITVRTSLFLVPLVALATLRNPVAGLQLALGGGVGVLNMLASMHDHERYLERKRNRVVHLLSAQVRMLAVGILPVAVALRLGQVWTVGLYLAGFFTPLVLYALEYRRSILRGDF